AAESPTSGAVPTRCRCCTTAISSGVIPVSGAPWSPRMSAFQYWLRASSRSSWLSMRIPFPVGGNAHPEAQLGHRTRLALPPCLATDAEHVGNLAVSQPGQSQFHDFPRSIREVAQGRSHAGEV